jgi:hypothetical protein
LGQCLQYPRQHPQRATALRAALDATITTVTPSNEDAAA